MMVLKGGDTVAGNTSRFGAAFRTFAHIADMTISSHNVAMKQVRIAELKARLSEYLRAVRRGETISVLDRDTPVAHIVPVRARSALRIRKPTPGTPPPNRVPLPKLTKRHIDVVQLLLEERQGHR
jgi:prevent-host-death family protein